jgi:tetratricopeptide (TPR) repeat protein
MERADEALRCYDQALALQPDFGQGWFNRGWSLERLGLISDAAESYAKAAEIHPQNAHAWAAMAGLAARRGDVDAVRHNAARALALQPGHPTAILALADPQVSEPSIAARDLRSLLTTSLSSYDQAVALGQLGDALDALGRPAQAFDAYQASNQLLRKESVNRFEAPGQVTVRDTQSWLVAWAEALGPGNWNDSTQANDRGERSHVFILGFPRSGTTLIESMLGVHPDVISLEERETLYASVRTFLESPRHLDRLNTADESELKSLRDDYWARVRGFGVEPRGKVFIDKNPFNTLRLPLICRLFPQAKIIFARRDPRDVVLSCFRRRFSLNGSTWEYLDLARTAASYVAAMHLAELLRQKWPYQEFPLVYEDLVTDFIGVAKDTCEFIGAEWRETMSGFADRARRGEVASASSAQIARGLYDGSGQWRRYRAQLAPVLSILAPWVERFGYPAD